ncbi:MAG: hypothetical protein WC718_09840 [Phycisphaerales bacterium]|jgi:hypothetical protein
MSSNNLDQMPTSAKRTRGLGGVLAALAGSRNVWRQKRRGSFLILVVGTLALLAVITILYVTIGNQDVRARAAIDRREQLDDVPQKFADYAANQVIGPDALSVWFDDSSHTSSNGQILLRRKTSDYPSINWAARSNVPRTDANAFFPYATAIANTQILSSLDQFLPTTPWLASTEPTFLDYDGNGPSDSSNPPRTYLDVRDWAQISNFAPDGRFVNLVNLRNNFTASHDVMSGVNGGKAPTLLDATGASTTMTDFGANIDAAVPAFFTARQRGAFVPVGFNPGGKKPGDDDYLGNQWADTDGDGMFDARWFELVDGRSANSLSSLLNTDSGNYRYFFAARAIDLSSLVNVNTAGDSFAAPTGTAPWGVSPADVDLRRLLMLVDSYQNFAGGPTPGGYDVLFTKSNETDYSGNYAGDAPYDEDNAFFAGSGAYTALRLAIASGTTPPRVATLGGTGAAILADYIRPMQPFNPNMIQVYTGFYSVFVGLGDPNSNADIGKWQVWDFQSPAASETAANLLGAERRLNYYILGAAGSDDVYRLDANKYQARGRFGMDSLQELLTYRALNNPDVTSPLEATLSGRNGVALTNYPSAPLPGSGRLSPTRSNRSLEEELPGYNTINSSNVEFVRTQLQFASDARQRLTTISGGRQFRSVAGVTPGVLQDAELKIDARAAVVNEDVRLLFRGFADALALDSDRPNAWTPHMSAGALPQLDTLFYGYRGPEAALHIAAHMAVNLKDMNDTDTDPSVYALQTQKPATGGTSQGDMLVATDSALPLDQQVLNSGVYGLNAMNQPRPNNLTLTVGTGSRQRLAPTPADLDSAPITKIYGVEPQPFVTAVASFTVYYDTPRTSTPPGDDDGSAATPPTGPKEITINGDPVDSNPDFLYRVIAFQLTNPFDTAITLSSGIPGTFSGAGPGDISPYYNYNPNGGVDVSLDRDKSFYYIEYGGQYFKVVSMDQPQFVDAATASTLNNQGKPSRVAGSAAELGHYVDDSMSNNGSEIVTLTPITIPAGKTVVLCTMSRELPSRIYDRIKGIGADITSRAINAPSDIKPLVGRAMGYGDPDVDLYFIPKVDALNDWKMVLANSNTSSNAVFSAGNAPVNLYRTVREGVDPVSGQPVGDAKHDLPRQIPASTPFWDGMHFPVNDTNPNMAYAPNNMANDQLVDRLIPPTGFDIDRKMPTGDTPIQNSGSGDNIVSDGFTIMIANAAIRPASPSGTLPPGALPGYCLQPKYVNDWNVMVNDGYGPATAVRPRRSNFNPSGDPIVAFRGGSKSFVEFKRAMKSNDSRIKDQPYPKIRSTADARATVPGFPQVGDATHRPNPAIAETATAMVNANLPVAFSSRQGAGLSAYRTNLPPANQVSTLRLADLLLPLGVGPEYTPYKPGAGATRYNLALPADAKLAWTTLSEALASAMGYDMLTPPAGAESDPIFLFAPRQTAGQTTLIFDRGGLRLDDYVPFVDTTTDGEFTTGAEFRVGLELPLAFNILDTFITTPASQSRDRAIPGLINVNTAPLAVLRLVPGLAPLPYAAGIMDPTGNPYWWRDSATSPSTPPEVPPAGLNNTTMPGTLADIASTVAAYRDKQTIWRRRGSAVGAPGSYGTSGLAGFVSFPEVNLSGQPVMPSSIDFNDRMMYSTLAGRTEMNEIGWTRGGAGMPTRLSGMSELPGMRSVGELLAARNWDPTDPTSRARPFNIDFMAYDGTLPAGQLNSARGFETGAPTDAAAYGTPANTNSYVGKAKPVSTRERLLLANVAMNSLSTRSDYFAVWFMVNGYKKADVAVGGDDNIPMIPSIQRRFLLVLDRSNVTRQGDKPKVLLFKELPVTAQYPKAGN